MALIFWQFLFFSFCGFLVEVVFARLTRSPRQARKCHLFLPVCPVYGLGALSVLVLPAAVKASPLLLFLLGGMACTLVEWSMSHFYEKAAHAAFWSYRKLPWNVNGRVCLWFSLFWGLLVLPLVYVVQPQVLIWAAVIPPQVTFPTFFLYLTDAALSLILLRQKGADGLKWYDRPHPLRA